MKWHQFPQWHAVISLETNCRFSRLVNCKWCCRAGIVDVPCLMLLLDHSITDQIIPLEIDMSSEAESVCSAGAGDTPVTGTAVTWLSRVGSRHLPMIFLQLGAAADGAPECRSLCCRTCGKRFAQWSWLLKHEDLHRGVYQYRCDVCGKGFSATSNLRGHMAGHTGVREHVCGACGRAFSYSMQLRRHAPKCRGGGGGGGGGSGGATGT